MDSLQFDGLVSTSYGQIYFSSDPDGWTFDPNESFLGQRNGLCGAAIEGSLFLVTGTHTGDIPVRVVIADDEPLVGDWEDVVEVSFTPMTSEVHLEGWGGMFWCQLNLPVTTYRVRWSATGFDAGKQQDVAMPGQPAPDRYQLTFWPSDVAPDEIVRVTGVEADHWHRNGFPR